MSKAPQSDLQRALAARFSDAPAHVESTAHSDLLYSMAARGSCRAFMDKPVPSDWVRTISAIALSAPTKSDLQQSDIIVVESKEMQRRLATLVSGQTWVADAPMIAVICGNNRRQRLLHEWHGVPFANDHLDALFNATGDAAITLGAFVTAAEVLGLGCCPISAVRNKAAAVSDLLDLPDHVFPFAGLAFGFPAQTPTISKRLPLQVTCHVDRYREINLKEAIAQYDEERATSQPYEKQRFPKNFADSDSYSWSEDKVRQYSEPERADFGSYIRSCGFKLD
ncbi:nitroreductase/FMN reductase [NAD(P)H] [Yoonia sediminilitoris]|uniref:Nitroreductase/FMN reductase [NAD(P)H] n=2 Tax=Yoonia sediminilitoris TaxID=1286148 RepID=A0A2T6K556_9RHOB|nr:nitroreductase/FMN reductase [NAD(P)H] [Yoonia sediminilitoris]RCW89569.1 nitroreductase/FMN reductase [NAD(P)H] [Yoonia sediminilitoris]